MCTVLPSCGWGFFPGGPGLNTFFKKELVRRRRLKIAFADWKGEQHIPDPGCDQCRPCGRRLPSSPCVRCDTAVCIRCLIWCRHCDAEHCRHCPGCPGLNARSSTVETRAAEATVPGSSINSADRFRNKIRLLQRTILKGLRCRLETQLGMICPQRTACDFCGEPIRYGTFMYSPSACPNHHSVQPALIGWGRKRALYCHINCIPSWREAFKQGKLSWQEKPEPEDGAKQKRDDESDTGDGHGPRNPQKKSKKSKK